MEPEPVQRYHADADRIDPIHLDQRLITGARNEEFVKVGVNPLRLFEKLGGDATRGLFKYRRRKSRWICNCPSVIWSTAYIVASRSYAMRIW
jgi:hypothetical protein